MITTSRSASSSSRSCRGHWNTVPGAPHDLELRPNCGSSRHRLSRTGSRNSQFNYPAFTIENSLATAGQRPVGGYELITQLWHRTRELPAPPVTRGPDPALGESRYRGLNAEAEACGTDCATDEAGPYIGPRTHRHPRARCPRRTRTATATRGLVAAGRRSAYRCVCHRAGTLFDTSWAAPGTATWVMRRLHVPQRPAVDHPLVPRPPLGMTRLNVYAGPAGFWLIRGG